MRKMIISIVKYYTGHIWCIFASVIALLSAAFLLITQTYLQSEYLDYLNEKNIETETVIVDSVATNVEFVMQELINIGCEVAIDSSLSAMVYKSEKDGLTTSLKLKIDELLNNYTHNSQWIIGMSISKEGRIIWQYDKMQKTSTHIWSKTYDEELAKIYSQMSLLVQNNVVPKIIDSAYPLSYPEVDHLGLIHLSIPVIHYSSKDSLKYIITMSLNTEFLTKFISNVYQSTDGIALGYIVDDAGMIIYHSDSQWIGKTKNEYLNSKNVVNIEKRVGILGWNLTVAIDEIRLSRQVKMIYNKGFLLYLIVLMLILIIMAFIVSRYILKPIITIISAINEAKTNVKNEPIQVSGNNEIWLIAGEFNQMMNALDQSYHTIECEYEEKVMALKKQRYAERDALESQINAHFICNTIGVINYEAMEAGNHKVSILLKKLSNILRYTFDQKHQEVYICQEFGWLEQYLFLQKTRFENVFDYEIKLDDAFAEWPCRKLMLQPFIENSIIHGFEGRKNGGLIHVIGEENESGLLRIVIEDNGSGMSPEIEQKVRFAMEYPNEKNGQIGIGISNVVSRILSYYGEGTTIGMETKEGLGTKIIIILAKP